MSGSVPQGLQTVGRRVVEVSLHIGIGEVNPCRETLIDTGRVETDGVAVHNVAHDSSCAVQVLIGDEEVAVLSAGREGYIVLNADTCIIIGLAGTFLEGIDLLQLMYRALLVHKGRSDRDYRAVELGSVLLVLTLNVGTEAVFVLRSGTESLLILGEVGRHIESGGQGVGDPGAALVSGLGGHIEHTVGC
ncbi:unknown [Alistipes sp. CAG:831]|nr:unknown [Alistipes sp. CAG:831]